MLGTSTKCVLLLFVNVSIATAIEKPASQPAAYSIPLIDLNEQQERQVTVDRERGQYLGHPTTLLLEDGKTILCVYPKGHGRGPILYKRSEDGGNTWSERLPTPENWKTSLETPTLHRVVDAMGKKRIILFSGLYPVRMAVSEDDGKSWSELKEVGDWGGIVAMASVIELKTGAGHYMALFHDDGNHFAMGVKTPGGFVLYKSLSTDGGLTWSTPDAIFKSAEIHLCEPGAFRSPDGKQIAVLLRENRRLKNSHVIFSDDEGQSWTEPREVPGSLTGDRHTAKYGPDGRLFISFRDVPCKGHLSPTAGDWVGWVGTYEDIVKGREGQYRVRLKKNYLKWDCAYPGVEILPDSTFVVTTYGHWTPKKPAYILSVRFTLKELDEMEKALPEKKDTRHPLLDMPGAKVETYKTVGDTKLDLYMFQPDRWQPDDKSPAIVFFFGGGWTNGTPRQFLPHCKYLASRGMVAIAADYRVASRDHIKAVECVKDAKSAIRFVRKNAARLGVDPDRIVAAGGSAGGHLAAACGTITGFEEADEDAQISSKPNAMLLFNPPVVLAPVYGLSMDEKRLVSLGDRLGVNPRDLSPYHHIARGAPPTAIFHGKADEVVPYETVVEFTKAMKDAGNTCELFGYDDQGHGFFNEGRAGNQMFVATLKEADKFLARLGYLQGEPTLENPAGDVGK